MAEQIGLEEIAMKRIVKWLMPLGLLALAGCVVAPVRGYYYGPSVAVVAPLLPPVLVVRPWH